MYHGQFFFLFLMENSGGRNVCVRSFQFEKESVRILLQDRFGLQLKINYLQFSFRIYIIHLDYTNLSIVK